MEFTAIIEKAVRKKAPETVLAEAAKKAEEARLKMIDNIVEAIIKQKNVNIIAVDKEVASKSDNCISINERHRLEYGIRAYLAKKGYLRIEKFKGFPIYLLSREDSGEETTVSKKDVEGAKEVVKKAIEEYQNSPLSEIASSDPNAKNPLLLVATELKILEKISKKSQKTELDPPDDVDRAQLSVKIADFLYQIIYNDEPYQNAVPYNLPTKFGALSEELAERYIREEHESVLKRAAREAALITLSLVEAVRKL